MFDSSNVKDQYKESAIDALSVDISAADVTFKKPARSLIIGVAGDVKVTTLRNNTVTISACPAGILPLCVKKVFKVGTTATSITALF